MTSNIDSQFQKAGFDAERIAETHGSLDRLQCLQNCAKSGVWKENAASRSKRRVNTKTFRIKDLKSIPKCPHCGSIARPNVSLSSDTNETFNDAYYLFQKQKLLSWLDRVRADPSSELIVLEVGCGTSIHSLRIESEVLLYHDPALSGRVRLVRINPADFAVSNSSDLVASSRTPKMIGIPLFGAQQALEKITDAALSLITSAFDC